MLKLFLEFLIKLNSEYEERKSDFKRRREDFYREWNEWHNPKQIKINSSKYR